MKIKIISRKNNPLFWRDEIEGKIVYEEGTPRKEELIELLSKELGVDKGLILIKTKQKFGFKEISIFAKVYTSKEKMVQIEGKALKGRKKKEEGIKEEEKEGKKEMGEGKIEKEE